MTTSPSPRRRRRSSFRLDRITDDLDRIARLIGDDLTVPIGDPGRRRMKALLARLERGADELSNLATEAAHNETAIEAGTN